MEDEAVRYVESQTTACRVISCIHPTPIQSTASIHRAVDPTPHRHVRTPTPVGMGFSPTAVSVQSPIVETCFAAAAPEAMASARAAEAAKKRMVVVVLVARCLWGWDGVGDGVIGLAAGWTFWWAWLSGCFEVPDRPAPPYPDRPAPPYLSPSVSPRSIPNSGRPVFCFVLRLRWAANEFNAIGWGSGCCGRKRSRRRQSNQHGRHMNGHAPPTPPKKKEKKSRWGSRGASNLGHKFWLLSSLARAGRYFSNGRATA